MENSILTSTKKIVGLTEDYTAFDPDITMFINSALSTAEQVGVGFVMVASINDKETMWEDLGLDERDLAMLKNYVYLKVKMLFDPPGTSFLLDAITKQIDELEYRMKVNAEMKARNA